MTASPEDVRRISRRLRNLAEPIAACVYFAPEALGRYEELGLSYAEGYFCSRSACMGRVSGEVVCAAFGVFNPAVVVPSVAEGWSKAELDAVLRAREEGATEALKRMIGEPDPTEVVGTLRSAMESTPFSGRPLFSGLRSLPFPDDPVAQLWRVCDYVREHRGDGHIAAWISAGCDAVEIGLLTELYWDLEVGTYIKTRGWSNDDIEAGLARLAERGLVTERAFTDAGKALREDIERATDAMEADIVAALGEQADEVFEVLDPWTDAVIAADGYPVGRMIASR